MIVSCALRVSSLLLLQFYHQLDEAEQGTGGGGEESLTNLLRDEFPKLPDWLAVLVTSRPESNIKKTLRRLAPKELDAKARQESCTADVRIFLKHILKPVVKEERLQEAVSAVEHKSQGLFLYLHWVQCEIERSAKEGTSFDYNALPDGLAAE